MLLRAARSLSVWAVSGCFAHPLGLPGNTFGRRTQARRGTSLLLDPKFARRLSRDGGPLLRYIGPGSSAIPPKPKLVGIIGLRPSRADSASGWTIRVTQAPVTPDSRPKKRFWRCRERIKIRPQHRAPSKGIPRYIQGHHPNPFRRLHGAVRARELLLTGDICRKLRIFETQYHRLEAAEILPKPQRWGLAPRPRMRVFKPGSATCVSAARTPSFESSALTAIWLRRHDDAFDSTATTPAEQAES